MTRQESLFAEVIFDLTRCAEQDMLYKHVEDSREIFQYVKSWAEEFDMKYPMPRLNRSFSEVHDTDYFTAIENFYAEKKREFMTNLS